MFRDRPTFMPVRYPRTRVGPYWQCAFIDLAFAASRAGDVARLQALVRLQSQRYFVGKRMNWRTPGAWETYRHPSPGLKTISP